MMPTERKYWFRAKRYGWGWGLPLCWQGWVAYGAYAVLLGLAVFWFRFHHHPAAFVSLVLLLTLALLGVCWTMGEPPRWRWGKD